MPQIFNSSAAIQQYLNRGGSIDQLLADVKHLKNLIDNNDKNIALFDINLENGEGEYAIQSVGSKAFGKLSAAFGGETIADGEYAQAEGLGTFAQHTASHAGGMWTTTGAQAQHVIGKYNEIDDNQAFIIGNGEADSPSNACTVDWYGNGWFGQSVSVGSDKQTLATQNYVNERIDNSLPTTGYYVGDLSVTELFEVDRIPKTIKVIKPSKTSVDDEIQSFEAFILPDYELGTWFDGLFIAGYGGNLRLLDYKPIRIIEKDNGLYGVESLVMHNNDAIYSYCVTY